jgi:two-component system cell cycle sensor histidine kinase/response regulator CckA
VTISPAPSLGLVREDPDQMSQILINLAANGRDAMPQGGRFVIRTENTELAEKPPSDDTRVFPGPAVLLSVSDTGQGMTEETRQHIFEPFFTTKEKGRGTGLGLSTVYGIVQQSSGYIEVQSEPGSGTTFNIYLPRIEDPGLQAEVASAASVNLHGSETVLVVEDQDEVRRLMTTALASHGFRVLEAPGGRAALLEAERHPERIHLLLTDVIMPDMNGKELADRLLPLRPDMRVLFTSGYSGEVIAHRGVLDSSVAYLPKPFTPDTLVAKVREVLGPEAA